MIVIVNKNFMIVKYKMYKAKLNYIIPNKT